MWEAEEKPLAIAIQKCPCLYDKAIPSIPQWIGEENAWEAVGKYFGFETGEAEKNAFIRLQTK